MCFLPSMEARAGPEQQPASSLHCPYVPITGATQARAGLLRKARGSPAGLL